MDIEQMKKELAELRAYKEAAEMQEDLRYTSDCALAECPCCGSLDVGGAHDKVFCHSCGISVTRPRPLQNAIDAWNTRTRITKPVPADKPVTRQDVIDVLLSTRGQSEGVTADAILGLLSDKGTVAVPDAIQLLQRDELEELLSEYSFDIGEDYSKAADAILSRYTLEHIQKARELLAAAPSHSQQSVDLIDEFATQLAEKFPFGMSAGDVFAEVKSFKLDRCPIHESEQGK